MPDSTPPRPTQRATRPPSSSGSSPGLKAVTARPGSSTQIPHTGKTSTVRRQGGTGRAELVSSGEDLEASQVRQRMAAGGTRPPGLSLRWKIVCGMGAITVATAILIFIVVYNKAVTQLSDEIDTKGVRLCKTLAMVDAGYWRFAIAQQSGEDRKKKVDAFLQKLPETPMNEVAKQRFFTDNPGLKTIYDQLIAPLGPDLHPLKGGKNDVGPNSDIMQITVLDETDKGSVQAVDGYGEKGLSLISTRQDPAGVAISDGRDKQSGQEIRLFTMQRDTPGVGKFRYNIILSLARINEAEGSLRTAILLPIFVSVLLGVGIAVWISTLITEPIKALVQDMQQVSGGNLEHQTKTRSKDEVGLLASTFNRMTQAIRAAHLQEMDAKALEHDLSIASEIQSNLVPKRMLKVPGYDISAYYRPSKEVGGDYYDFLTINQDLEGIIVADVSGKGVPGSLVMTMARAFIRMEAEQNHNPSAAATLVRVNQMLAQDIKKGMFVTALYCILDKRTNEIRVASAGHNPLIVWRAASNKVELVNPPGIALGFDKGPVFERTAKEEKLVLDHGDRIVAYTDGTVEAMNAANQEFGDKRFQNLVQQLAPRDSNQMLNLLVKTLDEHKGDAPQSDDITIVTLRYQ